MPGEGSITVPLMPVSRTLTVRPSILLRTICVWTVVSDSEQIQHRLARLSVRLGLNEIAG